LEETTGAQVLEKNGVRNRRHLVVSGPQAAVEQALLALEALMQEAEIATAEQPVISAAPEGGRDAGQTILNMVKTAESPPGLPQRDPEPISKDEFLLGVMEAREDAEIGADTLNSETFGETKGWSFEENVEANNALALQPPEDEAMVPQELSLPPGLANRPAPPPVPAAWVLPQSSTPPTQDRPEPPPVPTTRVQKQPRSVTPPTEDRPQAPAAQVQNNKSPASKRSKPGNLQPALTPAVTRGRTPSPVVATKESVRCEEWSCPACTLVNPKARIACGACAGPQPLGTWFVPIPPAVSSVAAPPPATVVSCSLPVAEAALPTAMAAMTLVTALKKKIPVVKSSKLVKKVDLVDPLPQRNAAPRATPRIMTAGLVFGGAWSKNAASRWAERPVERLSVGCSREAEEDDPELACYLWSRQSSRTKVSSFLHNSSKWGVAA